ncbi:hypothetical protein F5148DRAFT_1375430 [Russula earlei]|uniref:Uncharacterized protein n=1 Tax=Russula earlei TaxID=71964 RepID=A0ACC0UBE6_9AGAM|nr:hypothetical protein F5148DRAFT_1375430 [Russula earlei]
MTVIFPVFKFLRTFPFARGHIQSFLAFLGRRFRACWGIFLGKPGTFRAHKPARPPFFGARTSSNSLSGSAVLISGSNVPTMASHVTLHELAQGQQAIVAQTALTPSILSADDPLVPNAPTQFEGRNLTWRSSGNLSIRSRASDRLSIITTSPELIHDPVGQPSRTPGTIHRQFWSCPESSCSSEQLSRPSSPMTRTHTANPRLEIILTSPAHGDGRFSPVNQPSPPSYSHEPRNLPPMYENRRRQSLTSIVIQNPSTESLPLSSSINPPPLTDEPFAIDTVTTRLSPVSVAEEGHDKPSQLSPSISSIDYFLPDGRIVQLINSDQVPRYTRNVTIPREEIPYHVEPLTTVFPYFPELSNPEQGFFKQDCSPWIAATHPDGALYFYDRERRLFTDTDMHNPTLRDEMEDFYHYLQQILRVDQLSIPSEDYDLVLDVMATEDQRISWSYYYACHETRCLFWLETYDASYMISELYGVKSPAHVRHRLESLYWTHWSLYPAIFDNRRLPPEAYDELIGILSHGCIDVLTSRSSTLPYDDDTMQKMIGFVQSAKNAKGGEAYYVAGTTRLLSFFAHWRFLYFHGQRHARLIRDQSVYDKSNRERSILITLMSPLLLLAPELYLRDSEKLWTDEVIIEPAWKGFMTKLLTEWIDITLWSTVMLAANVGFLAISGVMSSTIDGGTLEKVHQVGILPSSSQIASSFSVAASSGSIVIGMLLVRYNRTKQALDPSEASTYLYNISHSIFGLEPMAIIFSLPWAFLVWS